MKNALFLAFLLVASFTSQGQVFEKTPIEVEQVLVGSNIIVKPSGAPYSMLTIDPQPSNPFVKSRCILILEINDDTIYDYPQKFTCEVIADISSSVDVGPVSTIQKKLEVQYDRTKASDRRKAYIVVDGVNNVLTSIQNIIYTINGVTQTGPLPSIFKLRQRLEIVRDYDFDCSTSEVTFNYGLLTQYDPVRNELVINFNKPVNADEVDIEWAFHDFYVASSTITYDNNFFKNNATRVTTSENSYSIPLLYEKGKIIFRFRPIKYDLLTGARIEGLWTTEQSIHQGNPFPFIYQIQGHETKVNWQASTSFAEEAKRKSVVSYFDGNGKNRQTVTKTNTEDIDIVAQNIYDQEGRVAASILPAPTLSHAIRYFENFNKNSSGNPYSWHDLSLTAGCNTPFNPMQPDSGASRYYSTTNPEKNTDIHQYIPDANGYPFSQTEFTPDNSGRVSRTGGPGNTLNIGGDHTTQHLYGTPTQSELDRLFGKEVGRESHYFKNAVVDPNGQVAVSYIDMHGRTIATALSGVADTTLTPLPGLVPDTVLYDALIDTSNQLIDGTSITYTKKFIAASKGYYTFYYTLFPDEYTFKTCDSSEFCFDCIYDYSLSITDDCATSPLYTSVKNNFSIGDNATPYFDTLCGSGMNPIVDSVKVWLEVGSYTVSKQLTINPDAIEFYYNNFLRNDTCIKDFNDFLDEELAKVGGADCPMSCAECLEALGDSATFVSSFLLDLKAELNGAEPSEYDTANAVAAFNNLHETCRLICDSVNYCDQKYMQLLFDVSPQGGQYATYEFDEATNTNYTSSDPLSIFTANGAWSPPYTDAIYKHPTEPYRDELGAIDVVTISGQDFAPQDLGIEDFIKYWKPSWAYSLVKFHPEYCMYELCVQNSASHDYDNYILTVDDYDTALVHGLLNPINYLPSGFPANTFPANNIDPFYSSLTGASIMVYNAALTNYFNKGQSIWDIAAAAAGCTSFLQCHDCDKSVLWSTFKALYLSAKKREYERIIRQTNCYTGTKIIGKSCTGTPCIFEHKIPRFEMIYDSPLGQSGETADTIAIKNQAQQLLDQIKVSQCKDYASNWWYQINRCGTYPGDSTLIIDAMIAICEQGQDPSHPWGASTCAPDSFIVVTKPNSTDTIHLRSFADVLELYCPDKHESDSCSHFLISMPFPYNSKPLYSERIITSSPGTCACNKLAEKRDKYNLAYPAHNMSFAKYLAITEGIMISDRSLEELKHVCEDTSCKHIIHPFNMPYQLECLSCATCDQLKAGYEVFRAQFPNAQNTLGYSNLFMNFMNERFDMNLTAIEYLSFLQDSCHYDSLVFISDSAALNVHYTNTPTPSCVLPLANNDMWSINPSGGCIDTICVIDNDINAGNATVQILKQPEDGSATLSGSCIVYDPGSSGTNGARYTSSANSPNSIFVNSPIVPVHTFDTLKYTICNTCGCDTAIVVFWKFLNGCSPDAAIANGDQVSVCSNSTTPVTISPLTNDVNSDFIGSYSAAHHGTIAYTSPSQTSIQYTPTSIGTDYISYLSCNTIGCSSSIITINVSSCQRVSYVSDNTAYGSTSILDRIRDAKDIAVSNKKSTLVTQTRLSDGNPTSSLFHTSSDVNFSKIFNDNRTYQERIANGKQQRLGSIFDFYKRLDNATSAVQSQQGKVAQIQALAPYIHSAFASHALIHSSYAQFNRSSSLGNKSISHFSSNLGQYFTRIKPVLRTNNDNIQLLHKRALSIHNSKTSLRELTLNQSDTKQTLGAGIGSTAGVRTESARIAVVGNPFLSKISNKEISFKNQASAEKAMSSIHFNSLLPSSLKQLNYSLSKADNSVGNDRRKDYLIALVKNATGSNTQSNKRIVTEQEFNHHANTLSNTTYTHNVGVNINTSANKSQINGTAMAMQDVDLLPEIANKRGYTAEQSNPTTESTVVNNSAIKKAAIAATVKIKDLADIRSRNVELSTSLILSQAFNASISNVGSSSRVAQTIIDSSYCDSLSQLVQIFQNQLVANPWNDPKYILQNVFQNAYGSGYGYYDTTGSYHFDEYNFSFWMNELDSCNLCPQPVNCDSLNSTIIRFYQNTGANIGDTVDGVTLFSYLNQGTIIHPNYGIRWYSFTPSDWQHIFDCCNISIPTKASDNHCDTLQSLLHAYQLSIAQNPGYDSKWYLQNTFSQVLGWSHYENGTYVNHDFSYWMSVLDSCNLCPKPVNCDSLTSAIVRFYQNTGTNVGDTVSGVSFFSYLNQGSIAQPNYGYRWYSFTPDEWQHILACCNISVPTKSSDTYCDTLQSLLNTYNLQLIQNSGYDPKWLLTNTFGQILGGSHYENGTYVNHDFSYWMSVLDSCNLCPKPVNCDSLTSAIVRFYQNTGTNVGDTVSGVSFFSYLNQGSILQPKYGNRWYSFTPEEWAHIFACCNISVPIKSSDTYCDTLQSLLNTYNLQLIQNPGNDPKSYLPNTFSQLFGWSHYENGAYINHDFSYWMGELDSCNLCPHVVNCDSLNSAIVRFYQNTGTNVGDTVSGVSFFSYLNQGSILQPNYGNRWYSFTPEEWAHVFACCNITIPIKSSDTYCDTLHNLLNAYNLQMIQNPGNDPKWLLSNTFSQLFGWSHYENGTYINHDFSYWMGELDSCNLCPKPVNCDSLNSAIVRFYQNSGTNVGDTVSGVSFYSYLNQGSIAQPNYGYRWYSFTPEEWQHIFACCNINIPIKSSDNYCDTLQDLLYGYTIKMHNNPWNDPKWELSNTFNPVLGWGHYVNGNYVNNDFSYWMSELDSCNLCPPIIICDTLNAAISRYYLHSGITPGDTVVGLSLYTYLNQGAISVPNYGIRWYQFNAEEWEDILRCCNIVVPIKSADNYCDTLQSLMSTFTAVMHQNPWNDPKWVLQNTFNQMLGWSHYENGIKLENDYIYWASELDSCGICMTLIPCDTIVGIIQSFYATFPVYNNQPLPQATFTQYFNYRTNGNFTVQDVQKMFSCCNIPIGFDSIGSSCDSILASNIYVPMVLKYYTNHGLCLPIYLGQQILQIYGADSLVQICDSLASCGISCPNVCSPPVSPCDSILEMFGFYNALVELKLYDAKDGAWGAILGVYNDYFGRNESDPNVVWNLVYPCQPVDTCKYIEGMSMAFTAIADSNGGCVPGWLVVGITNSDFPNASTMADVCQLYAHCNYTCPPICVDSNLSYCDSIRDFFAIYNNILSQGFDDLDTFKLLQELYQIRFHESLSYTDILGRGQLCDTAHFCNYLTELHNLFQVVQNSNGCVPNWLVVNVTNEMFNITGSPWSLDTIQQMFAHCGNDTLIICNDSIITYCDSLNQMASVFFAVQPLGMGEVDSLIKHLYEFEFGQVVSNDFISQQWDACHHCDSTSDLAGTSMAFQIIQAANNGCLPTWFVLGIANQGGDKGSYFTLDSVCQLFSTCGYPCPIICSDSLLDNCDSIQQFFHIYHTIIENGFVSDTDAQFLIDLYTMEFGRELSFEKIIALEHLCDTIPICDGVNELHTIFNAVQTANGCVPNWLLSYVMNAMLNSSGTPWSIDTIQQIFVNCGNDTFVICNDSLPTHCDSLNQMAEVYIALQPLGLGEDDSLIKNLYQFEFGQELSNNEISQQWQYCHQCDSLGNVAGISSAFQILQSTNGGCIPEWVIYSLLYREDLNQERISLDTLCSVFEQCSFPCPTLCIDTAASYCDSIRELFSNYDNIISYQFEGVDNAQLLEAMYSIRFNQTLNYAAILSLRNSCIDSTFCDTINMVMALYNAGVAAHPEDSLQIAWDLAYQYIEWDTVVVWPNQTQFDYNLQLRHGIEKIRSRYFVCHLDTCGDVLEMFAELDTIRKYVDSCLTPWMILAVAKDHLKDYGVASFADICSLAAHCNLPCPDTCHVDLGNYCDSLNYLKDLFKKVLAVHSEPLDTLQEWINFYDALTGTHHSKDNPPVDTCTYCVFGNPENLQGIIDMVVSLYPQGVPDYVFESLFNMIGQEGNFHGDYAQWCSWITQCGYHCPDSVIHVNPTPCDSFTAIIDFVNKIIHYDEIGYDTVYSSQDSAALVVQYYNQVMHDSLTPGQIDSLIALCNAHPHCDSIYWLNYYVNITFVPGYHCKTSLEIAQGYTWYLDHFHLPYPQFNTLQEVYAHVCSLLATCNYPCPDTCGTTCDSSIVAIYNQIQTIIAENGCITNAQLKDLYTLYYYSSHSFAPNGNENSVVSTPRTYQYGLLCKLLAKCNYPCPDTCLPPIAYEPQLCNRPISIPLVSDTGVCDSTAFEYAYHNAAELYKEYLENLHFEFVKEYTTKCLGASKHETLDMKHPNGEFHYTLYYFDQAGNLVKTIPPAGFDVTWHANHTKATVYRYNTLNQPLEQHTPDGGNSRFWYDKIGKMVFSVNAEQANNNRFSYTRYDALQRIIEVGEQSQVGLYAYYLDNLSNFADWYAESSNSSSWYYLPNSEKRQVTRTYYDYSAANIPGLVQNNLRNRVAHTVYYDLWDADMDNTKYRSASHYSYDIHGNVDELIQENTHLHAIHHGYKKLKYRYDLISGKVNRFAYQEGQPDQFFHKYRYDADNRLTAVFTSPDNVLWEEDAHYRYYKHGPLARVKIGDKDVQGMDYAYTINGWLKGVNSVSMDPSHDMGKDGTNTNLTGRDVAGFALGYFDNDYHAITANTGFQTLGNAFHPRQLFNGNISMIELNLPTVGEAHANHYQYDQLNRLVNVDVYNGLSGNQWTSNNPLTEYHEALTYDADGNIKTLKRNGDGGNYAMDDLTYHYQSGRNNKLSFVDDAVNASNYGVDIDDQDTSNYEYDAIGNLVTDKSERLTIDWNVYGKIRSVVKDPTMLINPSTGNRLDFVYAPDGNRIQKSYTTYTGTPLGGIGGGGNNVAAHTRHTYYVRDASGNVLSTYTWNELDTFKQGDITLYGSSRIGLWEANRVLYEDTVKHQPEITNLQSTTNALDENIVNVEAGIKQYELSNHLGNVLATFSDRKIPVVPGGIFDHFDAEVRSANDYYSFGMLMPGRTFSSGSYTYGFNGKEKDDEVKGEGNSLDFGARIYDGRLGLFLSLDPLSKKYPSESNYTYAGNSPIVLVDKEGKDKIWYVNVILKDGTTLTIATKRIINNQCALHHDASMDGLGYLYATDKKQTITLDLRDNKISVSGEEDDYTSQKSFTTGLKMKATALTEGKEARGKQAGGWTMTSEFAENVDGPKTDATEGSSGYVNVDLIMAAFGAKGKSLELPNIKEPLGPAEALNTIKEFISESKELVENYKKTGETEIKESSKAYKCSTCSFEGTSKQADSIQHVDGDRHTIEEKKP